MGTSPFGALRLTTVPSPCVSVTFLGNRTQDCQNGGTADYADWSRLRACYRTLDCQCVLEITKDTKGFWMIRGLVDWEMWGAAPRPGREKFSLHPRHVRWTCLKDVAVESNGYAFTHSGLPVALAARSVLRFLFSVLRGGTSRPLCLRGKLP